jgi:uncharacterized protein YkwD
MKPYALTWARTIEAVATLSLLVFAGSVPAQQLVPSMDYPIFAWTNMARQQQGRGPLTTNAKLTQAAQMHAMNMAAQEHMSHNLNGQGLVDRIRMVGYAYGGAAENVAFNFGYQNPGWKLFESWMISPGHYQNIMNGQFTEIGVAVAQSASGKFYACQVFGHPASPPMMSPYMYPYGYPNYSYGSPWSGQQQQPHFYFLSDSH